MAEEEFAEIERLANVKTIDNDPVRAFETGRKQAEEMGALAFFGDKYGETVRVVEIGSYSRELCGGTHTPSSGQVGPLVVLGEASIGSNLRRVEALTGTAGYAYLTRLRKALTDTGSMLRVPPEQVPGRVTALVERAERLEDELGKVADRERAEEAAALSADAERIRNAGLVIAAREEVSPDDLRSLGVTVRERLGRGVVVLGSRNRGKGALVAVVSKDLVDAGLDASELLMPGARILGGGGSRDPELAQAGGPQGDRMEEALAAVREAAGRALAEV